MYVNWWILEDEERVAAACANGEKEHGKQGFQYLEKKCKYICRQNQPSLGWRAPYPWPLSFSSADGIERSIIKHSI